MASLYPYSADSALGFNLLSQLQAFDHHTYLSITRSRLHRFIPPTAGHSKVFIRLSSTCSHAPRPPSSQGCTPHSSHCRTRRPTSGSQETTHPPAACPRPAPATQSPSCSRLPAAAWPPQHQRLPIPHPLRQFLSPFACPPRPTLSAPTSAAPISPVERRLPPLVTTSGQRTRGC